MVPGLGGWAMLESDGEGRMEVAEEMAHPREPPMSPAVHPDPACPSPSFATLPGDAKKQPSQCYQKDSSTPVPE